MKFKIMCLTALFLSIVSISMADPLPQYTVTLYSPRIGTGGGGPFVVDPVDPGATFYTFCIEANEYFTPGNTYWGSIESYAVYGGRYVDTYGGTPSSKNTTDPVSINTKKLYDYALDNWNTLIPQNRDDIQQAIWAYEGEIAIPALGANWYYDNAPNFTLDRNIMALNLWTYDVSPPYDTDFNFGKKAQSMLIQVPESGILILLGIAMSAIGMAYPFVRKI